jgi:transposase
MVIRKRNWLLKKLRAIRRKGNYEVYFEDEVHFQRATTIIRSWSLKGIVSEIKSPSVKEKTSFFGTMGADNGQLIIMGADLFCAVSFRKFLETVLKKATTKKKILMVLDNARYHHAKMNKEFIKEIKPRMELIYLPPYSPELNPIEFLWKKTRRAVTHNRYFESLEEQRTVLKSFFDKFRKSNDELTSLSANI